MKTIKLKQILSLGCLMVAAALTLGGCENSDIETYNSKSKVWFTVRQYSPSKGWVDVNKLSRTFSVKPGSTSMDTYFAVNLIGPVQAVDRTYKVAVVDSLTTALPSEYEIQPTKIKANAVVDSLCVKIIKSPRLDNEEVTLTLQIVENETFAVGYYNRLQVSVTYSNQTMQPEWWDKDLSLAYLGNYSKEKFDALYLYCQENDIEDVENIILLDRSELRKLLLGFKKYIVKEGLKEADGSEIEIPVY